MKSVVRFGALLLALLVVKALVTEKLNEKNKKEKEAEVIANL